MNINDVIFKSAFEIAKEEMFRLKTKKSILNYYNVFANMVNEHEWVTVPTNGKSLCIYVNDVKKYVAINSKFDNNYTIATKQMQLDINIIIDIIRDNNFDGIVVDPEKDPFYITRKAIYELTNRKDVVFQ